MDTDLRDLYQEIILDHNKNPKNFHKLDPASHSAEGYNPLCGDKINVYLQVEDGKIVDIGFEGSGCAISKASASVMTTIVKNKTVEEVKALFEKFKGLVTGKVEPDMLELGKLAVFAGVRDYPSRAKCATLSWHTVMAALNSKEEQAIVSTE
ncbi:MAG: SUF system NifU family Fe-S cluster assembly protein [Deferribacteres bacterium]|nr:SUF system NifU family Fe-S cluster assembly protein [candidate division KSB1 bacterium]MCB9511981.1 SUF system NifU family Fe-S cluster assembly protein [Deferribacteres bacterium]